MPLPSTAISYGEVLLLGTTAAGGSNNRLTNFSFHYKRDSTIPGLSKPDLDTIFQANVATPIAAALNVRWLQSGNTVRWLDDANDAPVLFAHALAGAIAGDSMSTILSSFILLRTGLRGKSFRGSKHLYPLSETDTTLATDDILNAAALARFATINAALLAPLVDASGNTWRLQVLSRTLSQLKINPTTVIANQVSAVLVNKRVGRMRHREVKSVY